MNDGTPFCIGHIHFELKQNKNGPYYDTYIVHDAHCADWCKAKSEQVPVGAVRR